MLTNLRIRNFKGWKDTGSIEMAPITLFFGANSSGKSSIGHFLMMLKQTVESSDKHAVLYTGAGNTPVQLGSFKNIIYRHGNKNIEFSYRWTLPKVLSFRDPISGDGFECDSIEFSASIGLKDEASYQPFVDAFEYILYMSDNEIMTVSYKYNKDKKSYFIDSKGYKLTKKIGRAWQLPPPNRFYGFADEVVAYHKNADFAQSLNLAQEQLFNSMFYLGPLRIKADRIYAWSGIHPEHVGYSGENAIAALLAAQNRRLNLRPKSRRKTFAEIIAMELANMNLIKEFKADRISQNRQEYEVKVKTQGAEEAVDIPDVGIGVSQVLPVLV